MQLAKLLSNMSIDQLRPLTMSLGISETIASKKSFIEQLELTMPGRERLRHLLSDRPLRLMLFRLLSEPSLMFDALFLRAVANQCGGRVELLFVHGLLLPYGANFVLALDVHRVLAEELLVRFHLDQHCVASEPAERLTIRQMLPALLSFVARHEPPLTQDGVMHKTELRKLLELTGECEVQRGEQRYGSHPLYLHVPDACGLMLIYAERVGWTDVHERGARRLLTLTPLGAAQIEAEPPLESLRELWFRHVRRYVPNVHAVVYWLLKGASQQPLTYDAARDVFAPFVQPFHALSGAELYEQKILKPLIWFEWLSIEQGKLTPSTEALYWVQARDGRRESFLA